MMNWLWLGAAVVFGLIEAATAALVSVWFVGGAVAALLVSLLGGALWLQILLFLAVSAVILALTRPLVKKMAGHVQHRRLCPGDGGHRRRRRYRRRICKGENVDSPQQQRRDHSHRHRSDRGANRGCEALCNACPCGDAPWIRKSVWRLLRSERHG